MPVDDGVDGHRRFGRLECHAVPEESILPPAHYPYPYPYPLAFRPNL